MQSFIQVFLFVAVLLFQISISGVEGHKFRIKQCSRPHSPHHESSTISITALPPSYHSVTRLPSFTTITRLPTSTILSSAQSLYSNSSTSYVSSHYSVPSSIHYSTTSSKSQVSTTSSTALSTLSSTYVQSSSVSTYASTSSNTYQFSATTLTTISTTFASTTTSTTTTATATTTTSTTTTISDRSTGISSTSMTTQLFSTLTTSTKSETTTTTTIITIPTLYSPADEASFGGRYYKDSEHFRVYAAQTDPIDETLNMLEGQFDCFVNHLNWRSPGLSNYDATDSGMLYKTNVVAVQDLGGSAGVQNTNWGMGLAYISVVTPYLPSSDVTCHEYGHALHYHQKTWVGQIRTGAWWETVANWAADTYKSSDVCKASREKVGRPVGPSMINVHKVIGDSYQVIVDGRWNGGNYYDAWPFLTYLTMNPDGYSGLGTDTLRQMMVQYKLDSNEDPLHTLARVSGMSVATIVGRYWARMAFVDIGSEAAQQVFNQYRDSLNYANLKPELEGTYEVLDARKPQYMGANIIPLDVTGPSVQVNVAASGPCTATLAIRNQDSGVVRYVDLVQGVGSTDIGPREEVRLVVANTPSELILYDAFALTEEVTNGLTYSVTLVGATVSSVAIGTVA